MYIFTILVITKTTFQKHISSECYQTLTQAVQFIENRADCPVKIDEMRYASDRHIYEIHKLRLVR